MTLDMWLVLGILIVAIVFFITEWLRVDVVALGVVITLMITGILSTSEALSGFSSTSVLTIAALFVVGGAVLQTGLAGQIGRQILTVAGTSETRLIVVLMLAVALLSGFMSDTGTVAVLLPAVIVLAKNAELSPSRLLIPLAYGSLLGGAMTLIGTPPNIIVSDLLTESGLEPFSFFSYTPMGLILLVIGIFFMLFMGRKLLPVRKLKREAQRVARPEEIVEMYRLPDQLFRLRVRRGSAVVGKTVGEAHLRRDYELTILRILRPLEPRPKFSLGQSARSRSIVEADNVKDIPLNPEVGTVIELDDVLIVGGTADDVAHAAAQLNLGVQPTKLKDKKSLIGREVGVAEVLLPPRSSFIGKTLVQAKFGSQYKLSVLGISRPGFSDMLDLKETKLQMGDTLLVQGAWHDILELRQQRADFIVMGQPEAMLGTSGQHKAKMALVILLGMLIMMITNVLPVTTTAMLAGLAMILTGCLTIDDAYRAIDWKSVVLVAGMLPMSTALEKVGLVDIAAGALVNSLGELSLLAVLGGLFLATSIFTQVLSNTATAVIIAPIALATANSLAVSPYAFMMAVAVAASMAFATPVASPVNTLVMGGGDYKFSDYAKTGIPMIILALIAAMIFLPILFPF